MFSYRLFASFSFLLMVYGSFSQKATAVTVNINKASGFVEISNGLVGIAVPGAAAEKSKKFGLAPIQYLMYRNGVNSDNTINLLKSPTSPISFKSVLVKNTADEVTIRLEYRFQKVKFEMGKEQYRGGGSGPGFYYCNITVKKNEEYIVVEEDTDYDIEYSFKISKGLNPDRARYRGWQSSSPTFGYEPGGSVYRSEDSRGYGLDATVDLNYSTSIEYPKLTLWEPAGGEINTGRYWQLFNSRANDESVLMGFFQGKPSRLIGARSVGPYLKLSPEESEVNEKSIAEIVVSINRRGPDNSWFPRKRFQWGIYISTKKNLNEPEKVQPIGIALNDLSGIGRRIKSYSSKPGKLSTAFYSGAIYMSASQVQSLQKAIKEDKKVYELTLELEPGYKPIWDSWKWADSALSLLAQLKQLRKSIEDQYVKGDGTYKNNHRYWKGVLNYKYYALCASSLHANPLITLSGQDKVELQELVLMMARVLWDNDNVPFFDSSGVNMGPANMAFQYRNTGRIFFALLLANDPEFKERVKQIPAMVKKDLRDAIAANGAAFGSPHYIQATIDPILFTLLQLKQSGVADFFQTEPVITKFANFYLSLLTPQSVRFSNNRKLVSFGDGSEESAACFGLLATGLRTVNEELSKRLYTAYFEGPPRFSFAGPVPLAIDVTTYKSDSLILATSNYSGYLSNFRSGAGTKSENSLWVLNGDRLSDHRNDDAGEVAIYALGAPLSLSRSSFYYPSATDSRIRSVVVPENLFPEWKKGEQPIAGRSLTNRTWPLSDLTEFAHLGYASVSSIEMKTENKTWTRKVAHLSTDEKQPVFVFYDSVSGREPNIWSMAMMSESTIQTPSGPIKPERKIHNNESLTQVPVSAGDRKMPKGWNKFVFTGQTWNIHFSKGIDWQLNTFTRNSASFSVSQWATTWQNPIEKSEFKKSNQKDYIEEQQYIRIRTEEPILSVLLPYSKTSAPYRSLLQNSVTGDLEWNQHDGEMHLINSTGFYLERVNGGLIVLLSDGRSIGYKGFLLSGGIVGLEFESTKMTIRVHGNSGKRTIYIPFKNIKPAVNYKGVTLKEDKEGTVLTIEYTSTGKDLSLGDNGYSEFKFTKSN